MTGDGTGTGAGAGAAAAAPEPEPAPASSRFVRRPAAVSGALAVASAAVAVGLVAGAPAQRPALAAAAVGVSLSALGGRLWRGSGDGGGGTNAGTGAGAVLTVVGLLALLAAAGYAAVRPPRIVHRLELLPGIAGLAVLAAALVPLRFRWSRVLIDVGAGMVFLTVLVGGVVRGTSTPALLAATAATVVAWDAGENAVSLGGQVGTGEGAATRRAELVHAGAGAVVACVGVAAVLGVTRLGVDDLPLAALVALLVAGVALALAIHR